MEWTDISITVAKRDADTAEAIATMVANGGIYIEDYSDLEQQAWGSPTWTSSSRSCWTSPATSSSYICTLHPMKTPPRFCPCSRNVCRTAASTTSSTPPASSRRTGRTGWKAYYHAMDIGDTPGRRARAGRRHQTDRVKVITLDPGMAFGTGTHETTAALPGNAGRPGQGRRARAGHRHRHRHSGHCRTEARRGRGRGRGHRPDVRAHGGRERGQRNGVADRPYGPRRRPVRPGQRA